jgi:hypothetical protein
MQTQMTDRIMAGQNHAAPPFVLLQAKISSLLCMILSCDDSVFFHSVAAVPRGVSCAFSRLVRRQLQQKQKSESRKQK